MNLTARIPERVARLAVFILIVGGLAACSDSPTGNTPIPADIEGFLAAAPDWSEFSPPQPSEDIATDDPEIEEVTSGTDTYSCTTTRYSLTETPDKMTIFNPDAEVLWLGALLQGDGYSDGLGSLQELPIRQRAPLTVFIDLLKDDVSQVVENPNPASLQTAIGTLVDQAEQAGHQAGSKIFFSQKTTHSLKQAALDLGVSARFMGNQIESQLEYERSVEKRTLTAYFIQQMYTASVVLPQTPGAFFSNEFTQERLEEQAKLGRIGSENPPTFISSIVYGRMLMLTMTSSFSYERMRAALEASRASIGGVSIDAETQTVLSGSEIKVSTVGGADSGVTELLRTGRLGEYFKASASLTSARPLSYTVRPLVGSDNIARVSETTSYNLRECTVNPKDPTGARYKIRIDKLRLIADGCDGVFGPSPEVYYNFDLTTPGGTVDFTQRSAGNAVKIKEGTEHPIGSELIVSLHGAEKMRLTGTAWDFDSGSADEVMGNWDLSWGVGTSNGQRQFTRSGNGCTIRLYVTITKLEDLFD
jgi:Thiol-activated cytolysin